jgi:SP family general alpha glucoside:H+ symporter-like MFS transporter
MMQQLNQRHPNNYLLAMRILWAPIGLMIICWAFVPESPWFHARHGDKEKAMKAMKQLYGDVKGYDFEEEYGIIARTIEHERELLQEGKPRYVHIFKGLNLVSASVQFKTGEHGLNISTVIETHPHRNDPRSLPAARRSRHH